MNHYEEMELTHHGILGQKWGIRRYQNTDGTLTEAGKKRYYNSDGSRTLAGDRAYYKAVNRIENPRRQLKSKPGQEKFNQDNLVDTYKKSRKISNNVRDTVGIAAAIGVTALTPNIGIPLVGLGRATDKARNKKLWDKMNNPLLDEYKATEEGKKFLENNVEYLELRSFSEERVAKGYDANPYVKTSRKERKERLAAMNT